VIRNGGFEGITYEIDALETLIGRNPTTDITLLDEGISREHAIIQFDPDRGEYTVEDLQSTNGTKVNDLWLWFTNDFDPLWIHGQYVLKGSDYFSTAPNMGGTVISGPFHFNIHVTDHEAGPPETWLELLTGTFWNVQAPQFGSIFHEAIGGTRRSAEVTAGGAVLFSIIKQAASHQSFDVAELCESLGYELEP
jgi:hypothetical protein